jgi:16S rRNA (adenine1518-N6/adenine1519-N6)-dimethyltransferase
MHMKPKKSLGQNFLKDPRSLARIVESSALTKDDIVIEVGPGMGVLTKELAQKAGRVTAIEIDGQLADVLNQEFANVANVDIIHDDILRINLPELIERIIPGMPKKYTVIANIPYYITSPILRLFLETTFPPQEMILMVQKEVAERICGQPGEMSILALSVQHYGVPEYLFTVKKDSFYPQPAVDSAVIRITRKESARQPHDDYTKHFFQIVRSGFAAKRKTLANNLANSLHLEKSHIESLLREMDIPPSTRAQELSLEQWYALTEKIN